MPESAPIPVEELSRRTAQAALRAHVAGRRAGFGAMVFGPIVVFLDEFLIKRSGIHRARMLAFERFLVGAKLWELRNLPESDASREESVPREHRRC